MHDFQSRQAQLCLLRKLLASKFPLQTISSLLTLSTESSTQHGFVMLKVQTGLSFDEPLELKQIISQSFANQNRETFQKLPNHINTYGLSAFCCDLSPKKFVGNISKSFLEYFDNLKISLHDTDYLYENFWSNGQNEEVIKSEYLYCIQTSFWVGPLKNKKSEIYHFYAISEESESGYYIEVKLFLQTASSSLSIFYQNNTKTIADSRQISC